MFGSRGGDGNAALLFFTGKRLAVLTAGVTVFIALSTYTYLMQQHQVCSLGAVKGHKIACDV